MSANSANPTGDPNAGENIDPNLSVVPPDGAPAESPGVIDKRTANELSKANEVFTAALQTEYAGELLKAQVTAAEVTGYQNIAKICAQKAKQAVDCDKLSQQATLDQSTAAAELITSLRTIQGAARKKYLPERPAELEKYLIGESIDASRPVLESSSQSLIDNAYADRPAPVDTAFIVKTEGQRQDFVDEKNAQSGEGTKAEQLRAERDDLLKEVIVGRKKIQYAADTLWPAKKTSSIQARKDFKLPKDRPYSY